MRRQQQHKPDGRGSARGLFTSLALAGVLALGLTVLAGAAFFMPQPAWAQGYGLVGEDGDPGGGPDNTPGDPGNDNTATETGISEGSVTVSGGAGGQGGGGQNSPGGRGGHADLTVTNDLSSSGPADFTGGAGGAGSAGPGAYGGAGGGAVLNGVAADMRFADGFSLSGGAGGDAGAATNGGAGGAASLTARNLTLLGDSSLASGVKGTDDIPGIGGAGGAASLTVSGTLTALGPVRLGLAKNDGSLSLDLGVLLVNADSSAGATGNASFLLQNTGGLGDLTGDMHINTLILAGEAGGYSADFTSIMPWVTGVIAYHQFYIPNIVVQGTGNSLNVTDFHFGDVNGQGLASLTFNVTGREVNGEPMLTVNETVPAPFNDLSGLADKLAIVALNPLDDLNPGTDKIIFLRGHDYNGEVLEDPTGKFSTTAPRRYTATYGLTAYYFDLLMSGLDLEGVYAGADRRQSNYKPYFEGFLGELITLNNGGNAIARTVGKAAGLPYGDDWRIVTTAEAAHLRVDTGSHIDIDTIALTIALARQLENSLGRLTLGAFFETGWGDYDTYNNLDVFGGVDGDGDTTFYGGGLFARQDFDCGFYAEASGRAGLVDYDYDVSDDRFSGASYDDDENYWGAHLGLGYLWQVSEKGLLEFYDKLFWTHVDSGSTSTRNEDIHYDSMDSLRNRLGARYSHAFTEQVQAYAGAAWEHEFDGESAGWVRAGGQDISLSDNPDMSGSSGLGELGLAVQPAADTPLYIDLSVYGLIGTQEGVGGALSLKYTF